MTSPWITSSRSNGTHTAAHTLPITSVSLKDHANSRNTQDVRSRLISGFSNGEDSGGHASRHSSTTFGSNEYHGPNVIRSWSPPYSEGNDVGAFATDNRDELCQATLEAGSPRVGNNPMPSGDQESDTRKPFIIGVEVSACSKRSLASTRTMRTASEDDGPESKKLKTPGKTLSEEGRVERNVREKKRSLHISQQIQQIRDMITQGGMRVRKATKCCVLQDAIDYIRILQENQKAADYEKHVLLGELGRLRQSHFGVAPTTNANVVPEYITACTGSAPQPGSGHCNREDREILGSPDLSIGYIQEMQTESNEQRHCNRMQASIEDRYHKVFDMSPVGMAIASLAGALIDCNDHFCQITNITKGEIGSKTIFDLTSRDHLHYAFDAISSMISASETDGLVHTSSDGPRQCTFQTAIENRDDLGLTVALVTEDDGTANCFCVTLVSSSCPTSEVKQSAPIISSGHEELSIPLPMFPSLHDRPLSNSQRRCGPTLPHVSKSRR